MRAGLKLVLLPIFADVISESSMGQTSAAETVVIDVEAPLLARFRF